MNSIAPAPDPIHERLAALADPTRTRLLLLLERHELNVNEACSALQLPQSTVSRHLKLLSGDGWLASRAEGTSRYYRVAPRLDERSRRLWKVVREPLAEAPDALQDEVRAQYVLKERRTKSEQFFSSSADAWDGVRAELFGARAPLGALLALLDPALVVGDLGCGTGVVSAELAPHVAHVIAVDSSAAMLKAARRRLGDESNVELREGRLESLPVDDGVLDVAVLSLVLQYMPDPEQVLREARRVLRPGGRLLVVDLMEHERLEYHERMGHLWQGFGESQMREWLATSGYEQVKWRPLQPEPGARGPLLFAAVARAAHVMDG